MRGHMLEWLEAYHDGELKNHQKRRVEEHVSQCVACQVEMEKLGRLSSILLESPMPTNNTPGDQFVTQVGLRLPRAPQQPVWRKAVRISWQLAPVGLLGAIAILQAIFMIASVISVADLLGIGDPIYSYLFPLRHFDAETLGGVQPLLDLFPGGGLIGWDITIKIILPAMIGLLYCSWLASWWVQRGRAR
jgi:hypothetical protein